MDQVKVGMPCPVCRVDLVMTDRQGVEIDYCPKCRGVWLDRGELDKILERSFAAGSAVGVAAHAGGAKSAFGGADPAGYGAAQAGYPPPPAPGYPPRDAYRYRDDDDDDDDDDRRRRRRGRGFLADLFDF